ncbi:MAG: hypothetical protein ABI633_08210 [Burkholderiales bacterium]
MSGGFRGEHLIGRETLAGQRARAAALTLCALLDGNDGRANANHRARDADDELAMQADAVLAA